MVKHRSHQVLYMVPGSIRCGPGSRREAQLVQHGTDMVAYGLFAQVQSVSDLAVCPALGNAAQDLHLLAAQVRKSVSVLVD